MISNAEVLSYDEEAVEEAPKASYVSLYIHAGFLFINIAIQLAFYIFNIMNFYGAHNDVLLAVIYSAWEFVEMINQLTMLIVISKLNEHYEA